MATLSLRQADRIANAALKKGRDLGLKPLTVAVLDEAGQLKVYKKEEGSLLRFEIATGKAWGALGMGMSSRALGKVGEERPMFMQSLMDAANGRLVPVPGGVLIRNKRGALVGAVGISGDTSDNDEACAVAAIETVGMTAEV